MNNDIINMIIESKWDLKQYKEKVDVMRKSYKNGFAEVEEILKFADEESLKKIPESFKKFITENRSDYIPKIDPKKDLKEQNLLYETKVILSVMYRDYWATEEERAELIKDERLELQKSEHEKEEKYNYDHLFKHKGNEKDKEKNRVKDREKEPDIVKSEEINSLIVEEGILKKVMNKIKRFFRLGAN